MYDFPRIVRTPGFHRFKTSFCFSLSVGLSPLSNRVGTHIQTRINPFHRTLDPPRHTRPKASQALAMAASQPKPKRPTCPECSKPARFCLCARLPTIKLDNSVSVTILQHSLERKHHLNSTRIAKLGLKNINVVTVCDVSFESRFVISSASSLAEEKETPKLGFDGSSWKGNMNLANGKHSDQTTGRCFEDFCSVTSSELSTGEGCFSADGSIVRDVKMINEANSNGRTNLSYRNGISGWGEEGPIIFKIGKYGVTNEGKKQEFDQNLPSRLTMDALSKGFTVRKFQTQKLEGIDEFDEYEEFELEVPAGSVLLFPSENAVGIDEIRMMDFEVKNLVVLDGTWAKAKRMYMENPWLKLLPHLRLEMDRMSLYHGVRQQPKEGYLSTIESIVYCLKALGGNHEGLEGLLDVFESMVTDQRRCKDERLNKASMD